MNSEIKTKPEVINQTNNKQAKTALRIPFPLFILKLVSINAANSTKEIKLIAEISLDWFWLSGN